MTTVTVNGQQYSDDGAVAKDMQSGGFRTYLLEMISNAMVEMNGVWCGTAGGTANALTLTPATAATVYVAGQVYRFKAGASPNSAATTVAVSGLSAIAVQVNGSACVGGEILASKWYQLMVDASLTSAQLTPLAAAALAGFASQAFSMATAAAGTKTTQGATTAFVFGMRTKVTAHTRAIDGATGAVTYTGVGFTPRKVTAYARISSTLCGSIGEASAGGIACVYTNTNAGYDAATNTTFIRASDPVDGSKNQSATLTSFNSDGGVFQWTNTASPAAGTAITLELVWEE